MKGTYLLVNFLTILFPILLSFDKRVHFVQYWRSLFPALGLSGLIFLVWDVLFTQYGVWSFNPNYVVGIAFEGLPVEEILFFLTVPFACLFIYECLNYYIKADYFAPLANLLTLALMGLSAWMLFFYYQQVYSLITFALCLVLGAILLWRKPIWLGRFYLAFFVSLLPFYLVNGLLTSLPVVLYNNAENCGFRVGTIPFEDHFYSLALLLLNVLLYEHFKQSKNELARV